MDGRYVTQQCEDTNSHISFALMTLSSDTSDVNLTNRSQLG